MNPWDNEPDRLEFEAHGLKCIMKRGPGGHWNGYVGLPPEHPYAGIGYDDIDVEVHGGLTHSERGWPGDAALWWVGFDCAHAGDLMPALAEYQLPGDVYRDVEFAKRETIALAKQLAEVATQ